MWMFITWVAVFFTSVVFGLIGLSVVAVAGLAVLFVLFMPLAFFIIYDPALHCPHCGRRLKKDWAILESGRSGKFLICQACRIYVYTHRTLR